MTTEMRIAICCYPTYGGSGAVATELGLALARRGHEVHFLSYDRPARLAGFHPRVSFHRVEVSSYPLFRYPPYDLALASVMRDVAESNDLDILHVHYAIPHAVSAVLARSMLKRSRPRIVTTLHGTDITIVGTEQAYFHPTRFGIAESDVVTTVSSWLHAETVRIFAPEREIVVVPNFVDVNRFRPVPCLETRAGLGAADERVIVHISNFRPVKRLPDVVRTFARIARAVPARLVLAGDGPERLMAESVAREEGVEGRVRFLGEQQEVERVLSCADLFLLPSEFESFGLAALEALSCGVPVIATRAGGLPEVVTDGENGVLVGVGDVDAAATAALAILRDPERHRQMRLAARSAAETHFAQADIVSRYEDLYRGALADGPSAAPRR